MSLITIILLLVICFLLLSIVNKMQKMQTRKEQSASSRVTPNPVPAYVESPRSKPSYAYRDSDSPTEFTKLNYSSFRSLASRKTGFVSIDFETTGLSPERDRIIEIGAVRVVKGRITDSFSSFVNPHMHIPKVASSINHITDSMVADAPNMSDILPQLVDFIGDSPLIAHNASFDMSFLSAALMRAGMNATFKYADSLQICRNYVPGLQNYKLPTVADHFRIRIEEQHRAIGDCKAVAEIYLRILRDHP